MYTSMSSPTREFRVAICGGGICGLTLAVTLGKYSDIPIDIYESATELGTVGLGLVVFKRTWEILRTLGLDAGMNKRCIPIPTENKTAAAIIRLSEQPTVGEEIFRLITPYSPISLARTDLVDMLKELLPQTCMIHTSKRLTSYTQSSNGSITLNFADGSIAMAGVLIGADGIRSAVRDTMFKLLQKQNELPGQLRSPEGFRKAVEPIWTGTRVYRGLISAEKLRKIYPEHTIISGLTCGTLINILAFVTELDKEGMPFGEKWVSEASKEDVMEHFKGWEPQIKEMFQCLDSIVPCWAVHTMGHLPLCVSDHVAIAGDADAYMLGRILSHQFISPKTIPLALRIYQDLRLSLVNDIVASATEAGLMYEFNSGIYHGRDIADEKKVKQWADKIYIKWQFQWTGSPEEDWEEAKRRIEEMIPDIGTQRSDEKY
ncbi:hypothetical protein EW146_g2204 [Bondarzewia mesenterica]|uniref:FAD-binding domain-containing protein n=1 Tax=Bondarzewia mesenterica TaxID=1095465 RepID=A0A4S4M1U6_9AGAM|nr:hypothetical protein EW146_g2204 [Bondarzewia mesenterica]